MNSLTQRPPNHRFSTQQSFVIGLSAGLTACLALSAPSAQALTFSDTRSSFSAGHPGLVTDSFDDLDFPPYNDSSTLTELQRPGYKVTLEGTSDTQTGGLTSTDPGLTNQPWQTGGVDSGTGVVLWYTDWGDHAGNAPQNDADKANPVARFTFDTPITAFGIDFSAETDFQINIRGVDDGSNDIFNVTIPSGNDLIAGFDNTNSPGGVSTSPTFFGVKSDSPFRFVEFDVVRAGENFINNDQPQRALVHFDTLQYKQVPTPALLPGLVGMGIATLRKRQKERSKENA
ncbi:MAG: PTPA-CTERM sorting domain-containing protein [Cyanobacteria bacterium J06648_16]